VPARWKYHHANESEDSSAVWGAAWRAGGRAAMQDSARLIELAPLIRGFLCLLEDGRVEDVLPRTDRRRQPTLSRNDEVAF
jgi:hypothetical protein